MEKDNESIEEYGGYIIEETDREEEDYGTEDKQLNKANTYIESSPNKIDDKVEVLSEEKKVGQRKEHQKTSSNPGKGRRREET